MKQLKLTNQSQQIANKLLSVLRKLRPYSLVIFLVLVGSLYSFLLMRAHTLNDQQPSEDAVTNQVKAARLPHIDPKVVKQLQSLHDNSVNVQALFDQSRNNPFQ